MEDKNPSGSRETMFNRNPQKAREYVVKMVDRVASNRAEPIHRHKRLGADDYTKEVVDFNFADREKIARLVAGALDLNHHYDEIDGSPQKAGPFGRQKVVPQIPVYILELPGDIENVVVTERGVPNALPTNRERENATQNTTTTTDESDAPSEGGLGAELVHRDEDD
jgi:hypothetical protein